MNTLWIELKYASFISSSLEQCKDKSRDNLLYLNFRCPLCGDSQKNRYKCRGWIHQSKNNLRFKCFNCGRAMTFNAFLRDFNGALYNEMKFEKFKEYRPNYVPPQKAEPKKSDKNVDTMFTIPTITSLELFHSARQYVIKRKIPVEKQDEIYYAESFYKWINEHVMPDRFDDKTLKNDEPRIVFPLINKSRKLIGLQGRALDPKSTLRYITLMFSDDNKIFGEHNLDKNKKTYVVEGPIDSMFLPNAIAMVGADANLDDVVNKQFTTIIFDNEPRNREIVKRINKYISYGWSVCLWPSNIKEKDINDLILAGYSPEQVVSIVDSNTYQGLKAELKMKFWSNLK